MTCEKRAAALRLFFLAEYQGQCRCTNTSSPKANSFPWGGEAPLDGHPTSERKAPSEIRLPLPSAGFWTRAALGVQMVTPVVYSFGGGWMNRLGYPLNLVLAWNAFLHERLSGSGPIEHTGSNTAGPPGKAFTWRLFKILSLNGDYIRWPPVNLSFEVSSTALSLICVIQHEKPPVSQMQSTECEADWKVQQQTVKMLSIKYGMRKRGLLKQRTARA